MKHISEIKLIEYCAGRLTSDEADAVRKHLSDCDVCHRIYQQQSKLHQQLGDVPMPVLRIDMVERVQRAIAESAVGTVQHVDRRWQLAGVLRIAAVLALAAVTGHIIGLSVRAKWHQPQINIYQAQLVDEREVAMSLHLDALGAGLPVGMINALAGDEQIQGGNEQ